MTEAGWAVLLQAATLAGVFGNWIYIVIVRRSSATRGSIDRVDRHLSETVARVERLEERMNHMPSHGDIAKLHDKINQASGDMREMKGVVQRMAHAIDRMERWMTENSRLDIDK